MVYLSFIMRFFDASIFVKYMQGLSWVCEPDNMQMCNYYIGMQSSN